MRWQPIEQEDDPAVLALERSSDRWLEWLGEELVRRGGTPGSRLLTLWDVLEEWFESEDFHGSVIASAATELRGEPEHPAHDVVAAHRRSLRSLLEDLAKDADAPDPLGLADQLQVLFEGAVVGAMVDRQPRVARIARTLTELALSTNGYDPGR